MRSDSVDTEFPSAARGPRSVLINRIGRIVDYLFGILYTLLLVRLALEFFGARSGTGFVQIIRGLTDFFYAPFRGIFATSNVDGTHLVWPLVVAVLGYMLLHAGIRGLLHLLSRM